MSDTYPYFKKFTLMNDTIDSITSDSTGPYYADLLQNLEGRNWPGDYKHENGNYQNKCGKCSNHFLGNKHRIRCRACTEVNVRERILKLFHEAYEQSNVKADDYFPSVIQHDLEFIEMVMEIEKEFQMPMDEEDKDCHSFIKVSDFIDWATLQVMKYA